MTARTKEKCKESRQNYVPAPFILDRARAVPGPECSAARMAVDTGTLSNAPLDGLISTAQSSATKKAHPSRLQALTAALIFSYALQRPLTKYDSE